MIEIAPVQPKKLAIKLSKKAAIFIASGLIAILLLIAGAYCLGKYLTDEQRLLDRFEHAVQADEADKLLKLLSSSNEDIPFERKTAEGIAEYLKADKAELDTLMERLRSEGKRLRSGEAQSFDNDEDAAFVYLSKKDKKRWFLYDDYEFKIKRYRIPVRTNYEGAAIRVDGEELATAGEDGSTVEIGPFLPGQYEIEAQYQGEYTTLASKEKVALFPMGSYRDTVDIELEGDYVNVTASNSYARIIINDYDIDLVVGDGQRIGPIAIDGSNKMRVEMEYPWGKTKSEELAIDTDQLTFKIDELDETDKEEIMDAAYDFASSWMDGFEARDVDKIRSVSPDRIADLTEYFADMVDTDEYYKGELRKLSFDLEGFDVNQYDEETYTASVKARLDYSEVFYYGGFGAEPELADGTNYTQYELQYSNGRWEVSDWSLTDSFDVGAVNTKVYE
ncbi:TcaA 3rd/4th domain-containing protein [Cohnella lupini]|uniref:PEGA domain-containing protein n=1 Tax=Cohnella lupini TaxID=1294267 RepID=A0A3D9ISG3_9BACL|nr:hypothetical protein [Cohnella lupini]RED64731.1 hypothetical protein DFP95_102152 [Cohnella lupini]